MVVNARNSVECDRNLRAWRADYRFVIFAVNEIFVMFEGFLVNQLNPKSFALNEGLEFPGRVADGTRTRNNQNHNLGLYH